MRREKGFTLIELLVVITILGLLMAVILPNVFGSQEAAKTFACQGNLHKVYEMLTLYKNRHHNRWPSKSGVKFLLICTQDPAIFERTDQNIDYFFCPCARQDEHYAEIISDVDNWLLTLQDSTYAGRNMTQFSKGLGSSNLQIIVADDNEGGSNHKGSLNYLTAGGQVRELLYQELVDKGKIESLDEEVSVGPGSPVDFKSRDLSRLKVD